MDGGVVSYLIIVNFSFDAVPFKIVAEFGSGGDESFVAVGDTADVAGGGLVEFYVDAFGIQRCDESRCR